MTKIYYGATFIQSKFDALDGKTKVAFTEVSDSITPFSVEVDSSGLICRGVMEKKIVMELDLQGFAQLISDAWVEHRKMAPKIHKTLSGH